MTSRAALLPCKTAANGLRLVAGLGRRFSAGKKSRPLVCMANLSSTCLKLTK